MRNRIKTMILVCMTILLAASAAGCNFLNAEPQAAEDEIMLKIQLDLKEDIGLLIIHHDVDGHEGGGGISNADKSMIRHDETLYWTFGKEFYEGSAETVNMTLEFAIVKEYCDPNYDNIYPEEYVIPMESISFSAGFGESCLITITGGNESGYEAALDNPS